MFLLSPLIYKSEYCDYKIQFLICFLCISSSAYVYNVNWKYNIGTSILTQYRTTKPHVTFKHFLNCSHCKNYGI